MSLSFGIAWLFLCVFIFSLPGHSMKEATATSQGKILGAILSYEPSRSDPLILIFHEYLSMCEAGFNPTILFLTTVSLSESVRNFFQSKVYCYRTGDYLPIKYILRPKTIGAMLAEEAKKEFFKYRNDYDIFIYQEEDIIVQLSHIAAYVAETQKLTHLLGREALKDYSIGFQRYCRALHHPSDPKVKQFVEKDLLMKEYLDEFPYFKPICLQNEPYIAVTDCPGSWMANVHQGMTIITKAQLDLLEEKCNYLNMSALTTSRPAYVREYTSSLSLFANHIVPENCNVTKLLPAERISSFLVNHYYCKEKFNDKKLVFSVDMHIKAGLVQISPLHSIAGYYDNLPCWEGVVNKYRERTNVIDNVLIRFASDRQVYLLEHGKKRKIFNGDVFSAHNFKWDDVMVIDHKAVFDALPFGPDLDQ